MIANLLKEFPEYEVVGLPGFAGFMPGQPEWLELTTKDTKYTKEKYLDRAVRLFPHRVSGEGHFVCLLRRSGSADGSANARPDRLASPSKLQERLLQAFAGKVLKVDFASDRLRVRAERLYYIPEKMSDFGNLRVVHPGVWLGTFKKDRFEPAHPLALFLKRGQVLNVLDLSSTEAGERPTGELRDRSPLQAYLAGETLPSEGPAGWTLVSVDGWPLGWGKRVQGVLKNHFPKGWQIYS